MSLPVSIQDRVAFVNGANRGIGKTIVETFIEKGAAKIYAGARQPESLQPLTEKFGERVIPLPVDLLKPDTIRVAAQTASDATIVVNNAGVLLKSNPLAESVFDDFQEELNVNVFGLLHMAQAFAPVLKANGGGAFVQLNSVASLRSFADFSSYCASKAAAYSFTQGLRDKLMEQNTLVVSVHPGPIDTDMAHNAGLGDMAEPTSLVADSIVEALEHGKFHAFPDTMAKQFESAYRPFAEAFVEANLTEG